MKYYGYQIPNAPFIFIGTTTEQVINTLKYYREERQQDIVVPDISEVKEQEYIQIVVAFPMLHQDHFIDAKVRENVTLEVNANAFDYVQMIAKTYEKYKRCELYKFSAGIEILGTWYLPEHIMQGMKEYDWGQHQEQINEWMGARERTLNELEHKRIVIRARPVAVPKPSRN